MHGQCLALHPAGRHRAGVAAYANGALAFFVGLIRHVDKLGSKRFDLLFNRRSHIAGFDYGTQALGGGNGLQTCNTGTQNKHASGFDGTGGGHQHRHKPRIVVSGDQDGFIAGDIGLG